MAGKTYEESIRSRFNSLGATQKENKEVKQEKAEKKTEPVVQTANLEDVSEADFKLPNLEADKKEKEDKQKAEEMRDVNFFDEKITPFEGGFAVIKSRKTGKIIAVGLEKREEEQYILSIIKDHSISFKEKRVDYAYLPKESIVIFRHEWEQKNCDIYTLNEGLSYVVKLDEMVKNEDSIKNEADLEARMAAEGFVKDIEQFGEPRKTSTYLPDELIQYCTRRASAYKVYKGPLRWVLTNLVIADLKKHPELCNSL